MSPKFHAAVKVRLDVKGAVGQIRSGESEPAGAACERSGPEDVERSGGWAIPSLGEKLFAPQRSERKTPAGGGLRPPARLPSALYDELRRRPVRVHDIDAGGPGAGGEGNAGSIGRPRRLKTAGTGG